RDYRNLDEVTDVLSFSQIEGEDVGFPTGKRKQLGDIVISLAQTLRQAAEDNHDPIAEEKMLILHGMLHLLGYDHVTDNGEMMELQGKILDKLS
ncbi:MAG: rRNA maturation RNase YbeY, partial [Spirochaetales bacterium]|nr:rRNA maturation RNase YbeY [Spirochaetales bacterium]